MVSEEPRYSIIAHGREFIDPDKPRSAVRWSLALKELIDNGLVDFVQEEDGVRTYRINERGRRVAEALGPGDPD